MPDTPIRVAAMGDLHYRKSSQGALQATFARLVDLADVLVLCGDLTDYGLPEEAEILARDLTALHLPVIAVLGNHDFESGQEEDVSKILTDGGVHLLDGDTFETHGVGFAGVKGFCGGFGRGTLGPWGEPIVKSFVNEAVNEALKLESALARLRTEHRVAVLHYAPIAATVQGEPVEIFPWLGCGRLEEPLNRYPISVVFHGHAHNGALEGRTTSGIPVYNVSMPLLTKCDPGAVPCRIVEVGGAVADRRAGGRRASDREAVVGA